ncbi:type VII secretion protein EccB [Nocardioides cheoyonin]|uniref:type VII secretion protein EccB n=1 Tax=Nocardioides cheoyonin TaxID=3156615 RepID=UPI0032B42B29
MTTKKDLVEAHAFSRRRLVTAFVSGAPGGREVEPTRPGRTIVGGVALAVLLVAGAAIGSVLAPRASDDWDSRGLVVTKEGERYVVTEDNGDLRPVINLTSAQLILGLEPPTSVVSQETVDGETPGATIGIDGAPEALPRPSEFVESGWTACTSDGQGIAVDIEGDPAVKNAPTTGFPVTTKDGKDWLIAESVGSDGVARAYRFQLPGKPAAVLNGVFGSSVSPMTVPDRWLALFDQGDPLTSSSFDYTDAGRPSDLAGKDGVPEGAKVGMLATYQGKSYLVARDGLLALTEFEATVYANTQVAGAGATPDSIELDRQPLDLVDEKLPATWPASDLTPVVGAMCARLVAAPGEDSSVRLGVDPGTTAWPETPPAAAAVQQHVEPGAGAFVYSGSGSDEKGLIPWMVDGRGAANQVGDATSVANLGLGSYDAPVVSDAWIEVLGRGVELSTDLALCPPGSTTKKGSSECAPSGT